LLEIYIKQLRISPAKSNYGVYYWDTGVPKFGLRKFAESSSLSDYDVEEADLSDSDKDTRWDEITDDTGEAQCEGSFSDHHEAQLDTMLHVKEVAHTNCVRCKLSSLHVICEE
jgi:hypothetical protein